MRINYYLYRSGELKRQDQSLVFVDGERKVYIPIAQVDHLYIFGSVSINQQVIKLINEYQSVIFYFDFYGHYLGKFIPKKVIEGKHIIEHVKFITDDAKKSELARNILLASFKNMLFIMKYYDKKDRHLSGEIETITLLFDKLETLKSVDEFLMIEAQIKRVYYQTFDTIIMNKDFQFDDRSTYPPKNEVNAMMSFGYALLYARLEGSIYRSRLSIELPFIHGYSKKSSGLHHDIADIFKPIFVDRFIFHMINRKMINHHDFEKHHDGVYISKEGMGKFIAHFDEYMRTTIKMGDRTYSYQQLLSKEVHKISNHIHDKKVYHPMIMTRW